MDLPVEQVYTRRLIVLIPDCLASSIDLAHKIHWMADRANLTVLYLVLVDDDENRLAVSRCMTTLKAVTSSSQLLVESRLINTPSLLSTLQEVSCPGDVIVCQDEQTAVDGFFKTIPVSEFLANHLRTPIRTISGFYNREEKARKWSYEVFSLIGFLAIMAVFTWLQIELDQAFDGFTQSFFILGVFIIEMGAIWIWYKFVFSKSLLG